MFNRVRREGGNERRKYGAGGIFVGGIAWDSQNGTERFGWGDSEVNEKN